MVRQLKRLGGPKWHLRATYVFNSFSLNGYLEDLDEDKRRGW